MPLDHDRMVNKLVRRLQRFYLNYPRPPGSKHWEQLVRIMVNATQKKDREMNEDFRYIDFGFAYEFDRGHTTAKLNYIKVLNWWDVWGSVDNFNKFINDLKEFFTSFVKRYPDFLYQIPNVHYDGDFGLVIVSALIQDKR